MSEPIRAVVYGVGAMGSIATRFMREKGVEIVGALARSPEKVGKDLGEVAGLGYEVGLPVEDDPERVLSRRPDIVIDATGNYMPEVFDHLRLCLEAGANVATIAAELLYPWGTSPAATAELDAMAKRNGVTVTGVGLQDIYWVQLVSCLMGASHTIESVAGTVSWNVDEFGPEVAEVQHVGDTPDEFAAWLENASERPPNIGRNILGALVADAGLVPASISSTTRPELAPEDRYCRALDLNVPAGSVIGFTDIDTIETTSGVEFSFEMVGRVHTDDEVSANDWLITGEPQLRLANPGVPSSTATVTQIVNRIPDVINAPPGFVTIDRLPRPQYRPYPLDNYLAAGG